MPSFSSSGYSAGTMPVVSMLLISSRKPETVIHDHTIRYSADSMPVVSMLLINSRKPETVMRGHNIRYSADSVDQFQETMIT